MLKVGKIFLSFEKWPNTVQEQKVMISFTVVSSVLYLFGVVQAANFIDICADSSGNNCCADGMDQSNYWIMLSKGTWNDLDIECRLESPPYTNLVVFENRGENDCLIKYLSDEYRGQAQEKYAIGLKSPDDYKGVYEWAHIDETPSFTNWASGSPKDGTYVYMTVGTGAPQNGKWEDLASDTEQMFGICERKSSP